MKRIAIFPGSFDPFTKGHQDIVLRGAALFDEVIIAIGRNSSKNRYFPIEMMTERIESTFKDSSNIRVDAYEGLTADYAKKIGARFILRGLRNTTDFEYENSIGQVNHYINPDLETVFLITSPQLAHISSTLIRDLHKYGADLKPYLPYEL